MQLSFRPNYRRLEVREAPEIFAANPTRVLARLPDTLEPGRYFVLVHTRTHQGRTPEILHYVTAQGPGPARPWSLALLALTLIGALVGLWRFARPIRRHRGAVGLLLVTLVASHGMFALLLLGAW